MPKDKSITINGVSIMIDAWKGKSESDFIKHEKHHFDGDETKTRETWKLFVESQKPKAAEAKTETPVK